MSDLRKRVDLLNHIYFYLKGGNMTNDDSSYKPYFWLDREWFISQVTAPRRYTDYDTSDDRPEKQRHDQWGNRIDRFGDPD